MFKAVIVALGVVLLLWLVFGRGSRGKRMPKNRVSPDRVEDMVVCAQCGLHLPRSDALAARGLHYCSASHRDAPPPAAER